MPLCERLDESRSLFSLCRGHDGIVKQQLELVAQAHGASDALAIFGRIVASQQDIVNRNDLRPYLVVSSKEGNLLRAHRILVHQGRADASANLDEDVLAGAHSGDFFRCGAIGQHPVEEVGQGHTASQRLDGVKIRS